MVQVQFLQFILVGLVAATLLAGGMTGALFVRALASDGVQPAAYQPQFADLEPGQ